MAADKATHAYIKAYFNWHIMDNLHKKVYKTCKHVFLHVQNVHKAALNLHKFFGVTANL